MTTMGRLRFPACAALLLAACGADAEPGTFTASVLGATDRPELSGPAVAWSASAAGQRSFEIRLEAAGDGDRHIVFTIMTRRRPVAGAYAITEQAPDSAHFDMLYTLGRGGSRVVKGTRGDVVITGSERDRIAGRFQVDGVLIDLTNPSAGTTPVRLTGNFDAAIQR